VALLTERERDLVHYTKTHYRRVMSIS